MARFAFVVHPISVKDVSRKYPLLRYVPDSIVSGLMRFKKPVIVSDITGVRSKTGQSVEGFFVACPLTPSQLTSMKLSQAYDKIAACTELAARHGAEIVGLGAFTSVIGDGGISVASRSPIPVTTGNSYTVATAIQGLMSACSRVGIEARKATLAVVGATGSIGQTCARMLSSSFSETILIGRDIERTRLVASEIPNAWASMDLSDLQRADAVITVTSSDSAVIEPRFLKSGAVVCDVARPRDVSTRVQRERDDVLVLEGGVVRVPGEPDFHFNFGFPPKTAYACMSETMILALEDRKECFTLGKDVAPDKVIEIAALAEKHGFELAGLRSFEKAVSEESISRARKARLGLLHAGA